MLNPNISKLVVVEVLADGQSALWQGHTIPIHGKAKPGKRRLYICYSITNNQYYLKSY